MYGSVHILTWLLISICTVTQAADSLFIK